jgi:predicted kinase
VESSILSIYRSWDGSYNRYKINTSKNRMSTIYIMCGPPCSGKTTLAKKLAQEDRGTMRLNRDELRTMLRGKYVSGHQATEAMCTHLVEKGMRIALRLGMDVILDATHCKWKYIEDSKALAPQGVKFEYVICDVPYWKQRWRNFWRYLKTGIWIPSGVSKAMDRNFRETLKRIADEKTTSTDGFIQPSAQDA